MRPPDLVDSLAPLPYIPMVSSTKTRQASSCSSSLALKPSVFEMFAQVAVDVPLFTTLSYAIT